MTALICEVILWEHRVGAIAEENGLVQFEFDPKFLTKSLSISPMEMPLRPGIFENQNRNEAFQGLMGVFADSLPDKFGNAIIEKYYREKYNIDRYQLSAVQKLLYVGQRGMGALEYKPAEDSNNTKVTDSLEISQLVAEARQVIQGDLDFKTAEIMQVGVSAGGQYPKAVIGWNQQTNDIISGIGEYPKHYEPWMIKFDGAADNPGEFGKLEYAYSLMAKDAGIDMAETYLLKENGRHHFMVKRFDRDAGNTRSHMMTLCGLLHKDFNYPRLLDYEDYIRATLALTNSKLEMNKSFKRMVFNFVARNQDDHTKNFSYLMDKFGRWQLSPAYDITYANGNGFTSKHQMTINGKNSNLALDDLRHLGDKLNIDDIEKQITEVTDAVKNWRQYAATAEIIKKFTDEISDQHRI